MTNVCTTLKYAYDDFAASQVAPGPGHAAKADRFQARAPGWRALFNPALKNSGLGSLVGPRRDDGSWTPVDLIEYPGSWKPHFHEAASWGYSCFASRQAAPLHFTMARAPTRWGGQASSPSDPAPPRPPFGWTHP